MNIEDYQCNEYNRAFSHIQVLNFHIKQVHAKIKNYECDSCDYISSGKSNLVRHQRSVHNSI